MRRLYLGIGAGAAVILGLLTWRLMTPSKLGLAQPRVVLVSGDASVDADHARAALPFAKGATLHTGHGSLCFSIRASRLCMGANAEVRVTELGADGGGTVEIHRGAIVIAAASGEEIHAQLGGAGTVVVRGATIALEDTSGDPLLRALASSATFQVDGRPSAVVAAPDCVAMRDGRKRPSVPELEKEERSVVTLARRWQGSAGAVIAYKGLHGRVDVDGVDVGVAPVSVLLDEGEHTLVVKDAGKETIDEKLTLKAGQKIERGG